MDLNLKFEKMKQMGFKEIADGDNILAYNGHMWSKSEIENNSIAEIIKYKAYYDGNISLSELNKFLSIAQNYNL